jgi:integrase
VSLEPHLRDYLTRDEVASLLRAAKKSPRYGARNHAMILLAYRHGLRASEVTSLRVSDFDLQRETMYCRRAKGSRASVVAWSKQGSSGSHPFGEFASEYQHNLEALQRLTRIGGNSDAGQ